MPRVKEYQPPFAKLARLIRGYGYDSVKLGRIIECSQPTAMKKMKNPEFFTLGELEKISRRGHIPIEEIREAIQL